ncbi:MAG: redox-sensing transcriptional repressor Rex [Candidatus Eisenbacteria bacterium]|nr:redox-sensing transcriptional repressor Rex [Candidatus Eisenbacteria bacterium]
MKSPGISHKAIGRLCLYRRILEEMDAEGKSRVFSHDLAGLAGQTAVLVRRDLMIIGYAGSPNRGYDVGALRHAIGDMLDQHEKRNVALVGVGNLGRALLDYFRGLRANLEISAAFDTDPDKVGRVIGGTRTHPLDDLSRVIEEQSIRVAVLTVPSGSAQETADRLVSAGVRSLLNFTRVRLQVPVGIYVENVDISMSLEKVAYFARKGELERGA